MPSISIPAASSQRAALMRKYPGFWVSGKDSRISTDDITMFRLAINTNNAQGMRPKAAPSRVRRARQRIGREMDLGASRRGDAHRDIKREKPLPEIVGLARIDADHVAQRPLQKKQNRDGQREPLPAEQDERQEAVDKANNPRQLTEIPRTRKCFSGMRMRRSGGFGKPAELPLGIAFRFSPAIL